MDQDSTEQPETKLLKDGLRDRLTDEQWAVTQEAGTERAFSGQYWETKEEGTYNCVVCGKALFGSSTKFDSGTGWPSFTAPIEQQSTEKHTDSSLGVTRTEVTCSNCSAHLGHVFPDGPKPTGLRYCINSASLRLEQETQ